MDQDLLFTIPICLSQDFALGGIDDAPALTVIDPRTTNSIRHQHRRFDGPRLLPELLEILQRGSIVRIKDDLRGQPYGPLDAPRSNSVSADEAGRRYHIDLEQLRSGSGIIARPLVAFVWDYYNMMLFTQIEDIAFTILSLIVMVTGIYLLRSKRTVTVDTVASRYGGTYWHFHP